MNQIFDVMQQTYPSERYPIYATHGMVNCSTPQASAAGLEVLQKGGNAMDAAVAAAAALTVVEPTANGVGSDTFALIWSEKDQKLYGLNSSGRAPKGISIEKVLEDGNDVDGKMPTYGWTPVLVPGAPKAWGAIAERFGNLPLSEDLAPAVRYAEEGFPCGANQADYFARIYEEYERELKDPCFDSWFETYAPLGRGYLAGEMIVQKDLAETLRELGRTNGESLYTGSLAEKLDAKSRREGGYIRKEDLAAHTADWVEPISVNYRGYDVCEIPPNGQGIVALMALNILKEFELKEKESVETYHKQLEAMKLAFADALHYVTDPAQMTIDYHDLIRPEYGKKRAELVGDTAKVHTHGDPNFGGTVYLCTADGEGNMVSLIQSNYMGFGSGIVVDGTGIALSDRGKDFSLNPEDTNCLLPGKRSYHTIIPGFLMKDGKPIGPFGNMGGYMQPQGHVQLIMNMIDFGLNPQQAIEAPRWQWLSEDKIIVESRFSDAMRKALAEIGHDIAIEPWTPLFGKAQIIWRLPNGVLMGATESRYDSNIACY